MPLLQRIRRGATFLGAFFVVSVVGYRWLTGCTWLDAIYFFVISVSTVGYGETSSARPEVQIFTIGVIVFGVVGVGYLVALIIQSMIEGQIEHALGVRRMEHKIEHLKRHAIVCGYGRLGQTITKELRRRNKAFVVVDKDPDIVAAALEEGMLAMLGDATEEETLLQAGIREAETMVIALQSDADNVFLTLTARNLVPKLRIIARGEQVATEKKLHQAGADQVVLPAVIGGRRMAALVTRPNAAEMLENFTNHEKIDVDLEELRIPDSSPLVGKTVRETGSRQQHNLMIIGIRRAEGSMVFNPAPDDRFEVDDTLVVMGRVDDVHTFQRMHRLDCDNPHIG
ncbi:potassium channel family protein [Botrimarina colliarenosi]|uniref:potassium channel family protein n=1 Tax=Botrimarina colliarenosi TaxID=2528001 RepID=UPI0018D34CAA|nr:potassium channel protein [Botrimarina colliarenosi]